MKQLLLLCLFDMKAKTWGFVQTHPNFTSAERMLKQIIDSGEGNIAKYPEDFSLYKMGTQDPETGVITPLQQPELIAHAVDFLEK